MTKRRSRRRTIPPAAPVPTPMTPGAAARIRDAEARANDGRVAPDGFAARAVKAVRRGTGGQP